MRASKRRKDVGVDADGYIVGVDGVTRALLRVPGLALDALSTSDQERHAALFGALVASLPRKARLSVFIENRPADASALVAGLRAQFAPEPYTPQLGELGDRLLAWWARRLSGDEAGVRHVADLAYWLLLDPYPAQEGYPDQSPTERLGQAVRAVTRQLVAMGLPPVVASHADAQAFLGRHMWRTGRENINAYHVTDPATGRPRWYRTLFLVAPPAYTEPGWARALVAADCPATVVLHVRGLSRAWERRRQGWRLRVMEGTRTGGTDVTGTIAATDAIDQAAALHTQGYGIVKVGCYVRLEGATRAQLDARVGRVLLAMRDTMIADPGFGTAHQEPLYRATLPGYGDPARSTYRWDSVTAGNAFPFLSFNPGTRTLGVPLGVTDAAGDLVTLALDDPDLYNRIGVALGRVGTGKTSLLQKIALSFLLRGDMTTVVSSVDSFGALCDISGGTRALLGGASSATINVFDGPRDTDEDRAERVRFVTAALDLLLGGLTGLEAPFLDEAVRAVYAVAGATPPVMRDLYDALRDQAATPGMDSDDRKVWRSLAWKLRPFVLDGQHAGLVDGQTTVPLDAPLLAFNTAPLDEHAALRNYAYFSVFAIVDQRRALARARSLQAGRASADCFLGLDEAWGLLTSPQARAFINRDARKARHGGNVVLFASQQIKDLVGNADAETFFSQASFKALFSVEDNGQETQGNPRLWLERMLQLTPEEVDQAQRMSGVKGEYMPMFLTRRDRKSPRDLHGIVRVELTPDEAYLFASDVDDIRAREWWTAQAGGDVWQGIKMAVDGTTGMEATA